MRLPAFHGEHPRHGARQSNQPAGAVRVVCQITDLSIDKQLFSKPVPEAWFLNDYLQPASANPPYPNSTNGYVSPVTPRLLPVPYPIVPPAQLMVEFWNQLATLNTACQLTFLVMVPIGKGQF